MTTVFGTAQRKRSGTGLAGRVLQVSPARGVVVLATALLCGSQTRKDRQIKTRIVAWFWAGSASVSKILLSCTRTGYEAIT
jgi:hypothetical protein